MKVAGPSQSGIDQLVANVMAIPECGETADWLVEPVEGGAKLYFGGLRDFRALHEAVASAVKQEGRSCRHALDGISVSACPEGAKRADGLGGGGSGEGNGTGGGAGFVDLVVEFVKFPEGGNVADAILEVSACLEEPGKATRIEVIGERAFRVRLPDGEGVRALLEGTLDHLLANAGQVY